MQSDTNSSLLHQNASHAHKNATNPPSFTSTSFQFGLIPSLSIPSHTISTALKLSLKTFAGPHSSNPCLQMSRSVGRMAQVAARNQGQARA